MKRVYLNRRQFDSIYPKPFEPNPQFVQWMRDNIGEGSLSPNWEHIAAGQIVPNELTVDWETWWGQFGGETDMSICFRTEAQAMKFLLRW